MSLHPTTPIFKTALIGATGLVLGACSSTDDGEGAIGDGSLVDRSFRTDGIQEGLAEARAAKGRIYLADNRSKPGVVSRPSGLQYLVIEEGDGESPELADSVVTHYTVSSVDGKMIDNSEDYGGPQEFRVNKVIAGWREALQEMKVGSRWKLFVPPELAYGDTGLAQIPGGETLVYELELLGVKKGMPAPIELDPASPDLAPAPNVPGETQLSGLDIPEPGTETRRGDLSLDNLDLLD